MSGIETCGLLVAVLNFIYSVAYMISSGQDLRDAEVNDYIPLVWLVAYFCNVTLNTFLFLTMIQEDLRLMLLWFSFTGLILLYRIFGIDYDKRSSNYIIIATCVNVYIVTTFIINGMVTAKISSKNPTIQVEVVSSRPANSRGLINITRRAVPPSRSIGWNTNTFTHYTTRPEFYEVRNERDNVPEIREEAFGCIASSASSDDFDLSCRDSDRDGNNCDMNCCDNDRDRDNQSGGGGCDNGGGCDSGGGYDGGVGDDGGYDCGGCYDD